MKGLILKDFINLKKNIKIFAGLSVLYAVMALFSNDASYLSTILTMIFAILTITIYSYDDLAKWDSYALTMPISKDDIVQGKYAMMLLLTLIGSVYSSILTVVINMILKSESIFLGFENIGAGSAIVILFYSIIIPFITKLGVEKARLILFAVYIIPFLAILGFNRMMEEGIYIIPDDIQKVLEIASKYITILVPLVVVIILGISYLISIRIYRKKEF